MKKFIISLALLFAAIPPLTYASTQCNGKYIVGEIETIQIPELGLTYKARIDTGANTSSINAYDIKILNAKDSNDYSRATMRKNLGEMISFKTQNELGQEVSHTAKIVKISKIRNAQGTERRYAVRMDLIWNGHHKSIPVNLRDRSELDYKLLIGRNWLEGSYLVDVTKSDDDD